MTKNEPETAHTLTPGFSLDIEPVRKCAANIHSADIKPAANNFAKNMADVAGLFALPTRMLSLGNLQGLSSLISSILNWISRRFGSTTEPGEIPDLMKYVEQNPAMAKEMESQVEAQLASILSRSPDVRTSLQALLFASTSALWTAFECLCSDVWVAVVNSHASEVVDNILSQLVIRGERDDLGISGKQVSVRLLAKHNFDLRRCMGDVLKEKFDFSSVSGAQKAFAATFPGLLQTRNIFDNLTLRALEQTRNLIVHRGGIIDEEYVRRTKSGSQIGHSLVIEPSMVEDFGATVQQSGIKLLENMDDWLAATSRKKLSVVDGKHDTR